MASLLLSFEARLAIAFGVFALDYLEHSMRFSCGDLAVFSDNPLLDLVIVSGNRTLVLSSIKFALTVPKMVSLRLFIKLNTLASSVNITPIFTQVMT